MLPHFDAFYLKVIFPLCYKLAKLFPVSPDITDYFFSKARKYTISYCERVNKKKERQS